MMTTPKFRLPLIAAALLALSPAPAAAREVVLMPDAGGRTWAIAIHGGAGTMSREAMTPAKEAEYRAALDHALKVGEEVLASGGSALDAVTAVIVTLEDDPHFNAGKGAVFTWDGRNELDASIMDGRTRAAGAVAGVTTVRNPVKLARAVMEKGPHVMLAREGAEQFARENGLELVDPQYFFTPERWQQLQEMKAGKLSWYDVDRKFGTVGAVAVDSQGHVAAATSTGGMTGKRWGRIGDSPVIGAGTYADDRACAVSATGSGEFFIREGVAHEICARLRFTRDTAQQASDAVMAETGALGGDGGVIVVTPDGQAVFSFNTPGMYRARGNSGGLHEVGIFAGEAAAPPPKGQ